MDSTTLTKTANKTHAEPTSDGYYYGMIESPLTPEITYKVYLVDRVNSGEVRQHYIEIRAIGTRTNLADYPSSFSVPLPGHIDKYGRDKLNSEQAEVLKMIRAEFPEAFTDYSE